MALANRRPSRTCSTSPRESRRALGRLVPAPTGAIDSGPFDDLPGTPPRDLRDPAGWDTYWQRAMNECRGALVGMHDVLSSDDDLPGLLRRRGVRSILCVGNGLSVEAKTLSRFGFEVTALDLSPWVTDACTRVQWRTDRPMHGGPPLSLATSGAVSYVTGDLFDPHACPGPFDAVFERRTAQLYQSDGTHETALSMLAARLAPRGMLLSHEHQGWWKPDQPRVHFARDWAGRAGFSTDPDADRHAAFVLTTG